MKKLILILCIAFYGDLAVCPPNNTLTIEIKPPISPFKALLEATAFIESSGDPNALNRKEMAFGLYQIRAIRLRDYNQRTGKSYSLQDCYNIEISKEIYLYYASKFHPSDLEHIARSWNGTGQKTVEYWHKIEKHLK